MRTDFKRGLGISLRNGAVGIVASDELDEKGLVKIRCDIDTDMHDHYFHSDNFGKLYKAEPKDLSVLTEGDNSIKRNLKLLKAMETDMGKAREMIDDEYEAKFMDYNGQRIDDIRKEGGEAEPFDKNYYEITGDVTAKQFRYNRVVFNHNGLELSGIHTGGMSVDKDGNMAVMCDSVADDGKHFGQYYYVSDKNIKNVLIAKEPDAYRHDVERLVLMEQAMSSISTAFKEKNMEHVKEIAERDYKEHLEKSSLDKVAIALCTEDEKKVLFKTMDDDAMNHIEKSIEMYMPEPDGNSTVYLVKTNDDRSMNMLADEMGYAISEDIGLDWNTRGQFVYMQDMGEGIIAVGIEGEDHLQNDSMETIINELSAVDLKAMMMSEDMLAQLKEKSEERENMLDKANTERLKELNDKYSLFGENSLMQRLMKRKIKGTRSKFVEKSKLKPMKDINMPEPNGWFVEYIENDEVKQRYIKENEHDAEDFCKEMNEGNMFEGGRWSHRPNIQELDESLISRHEAQGNVHDVIEIINLMNFKEELKEHRADKIRDSDGEKEWIDKHDAHRRDVSNMINHSIVKYGYMVDFNEEIEPSVNTGPMYGFMIKREWDTPEIDTEYLKAVLDDVAGLPDDGGDERRVYAFTMQSDSIEPYKRCYIGCKGYAPDETLKSDIVKAILSETNSYGAYGTVFTDEMEERLIEIDRMEKEHEKGVNRGEPSFNEVTDQTLDETLLSHTESLGSDFQMY